MKLVWPKGPTCPLESYLYILADILVDLSGFNKNMEEILPICYYEDISEIIVIYRQSCVWVYTFMFAYTFLHA